MLDISLLFGRELLREELEEVCELKEIRGRPAFEKIKGHYYCMTCHTVCQLRTRYPCICSKDCLYCRKCIALGKVRECSLFYSLPEPNTFNKHKRPYLRWSGTLSPQQNEASLEIKESMQMNEERIIWAVTGAGKTEMLYEGIGEALEEGKRVCIASPRVDVCLELAPRLHQAFPDIPLALLYGGADEKYRYTQLVIATTHQLYRFKEAFDVIVIDEIDAFPYYLNEALYFATNKARKKKSSTIYLTATPDKAMRQKIKKKRIKASILSARYHKHPLPVPRAVYLRKAPFQNKVGEKEAVVKHMKSLLLQKKSFLVFIPTIIQMNKITPFLTEHFKDARFETVHSQDPERKDKVLRMRQGELDFLLSTTILERGVTFKNIDVLVIEADHRVYTEAALVQIAGRAGRSADFPTGQVTFYHQGWTRAMKGAIKQIKNMNVAARRKGYLHE